MENKKKSWVINLIISIISAILGAISTAVPPINDSAYKIQEQFLSVSASPQLELNNQDNCIRVLRDIAFKVNSPFPAQSFSDSRFFSNLLQLDKMIDSLILDSDCFFDPDYVGVSTSNWDTIIDMHNHDVFDTLQIDGSYCEFNFWHRETPPISFGDTSGAYSYDYLYRNLTFLKERNDYYVADMRWRGYSINLSRVFLSPVVVQLPLGRNWFVIRFSNAS